MNTPGMNTAQRDIGGKAEKNLVLFIVNKV